MTTDSPSISTENGPLIPGDGMPSLEDLMKLMADKGGSDLFVSVGSPVRLKINGSMVNVTKKMVMPDDVSMMMVENPQIDSAKLTELQNNKELNCAISLARVGRFRLSAFQQRNTQAFVLRFIPPEIPDFELLGMPDILKDLIVLKRGLVIVGGPTGSGKSTTLASLINYRNETRSGHILTLEEPIEFLFRHRKSIVNQREIGADALSYEDALKNAMRQAPDVILIGEVRDQKTMSMAMQYAQSGHLCLATLHANNSYNALNRIVGFYPPDQRAALYSDLSSSLKAIVSQRLIPSITGGRAAAVEVLINNRGIAELIEKGNIADIPERLEKNSSDGSQTFEAVLVSMVKEKRISVDDALLYSDSPTNLCWRLAAEGIDMNEDALREAGVDKAQITDQNALAKNDTSGGAGAMFSGIKLNTDGI